MKLSPDGKDPDLSIFRKQIADRAKEDVEKSALSLGLFSSKNASGYLQIGPLVSQTTASSGFVASQETANAKIDAVLKAVEEKKAFDKETIQELGKTISEAINRATSHAVGADVMQHLLTEQIGQLMQANQTLSETRADNAANANQSSVESQKSYSQDRTALIVAALALLTSLGSILLSLRH